MICFDRELHQKQKSRRKSRTRNYFANGSDIIVVNQIGSSRFINCFVYISAYINVKGYNSN
jgi:hypothetical protein